MRYTNKLCTRAKAKMVVSVIIAVAIKGYMQGSMLVKRQVPTARAILQGKVHSLGQDRASANAQVQGEKAYKLARVLARTKTIIRTQAKNSSPIHGNQ